MKEHFEECMKFIYFCGLERLIESSPLVETMIRDYVAGHNLEYNPDVFVKEMRQWSKNK